MDFLLSLEATDVEGRHPCATILVTASDKLRAFLIRRDVVPTNDNSKQALKPSVVLRNVIHRLHSNGGAEVYADLCSIVATGRSQAAPHSLPSAAYSNRKTAAWSPGQG